MQTQKIANAFMVLERWHEDDTPLMHVADAFGLRYETLFDLFFINDLCDSTGNPLPGQNLSLCANTLLMSFALRHGM